MPTQTLSTTNYDMFSVLGANRIVTKGHVDRLKKEFADGGVNITAISPIIVNENREVIDGQHRLQACIELGVPVFYREVPGLRVDEARSMNILQKGWLPTDYARSYAESGNPHYQLYNTLKEDYGVSHSVLLYYVANGRPAGVFKDFRTGDFTVMNEATVRDRLDKLVEIKEVSPRVRDDNFSIAVLAIINSDNYDHARMIRKLAERGDQLIRQSATVDDYKRALEDIFNYGYQNRVRLY